MNEWLFLETILTSWCNRIYRCEIFCLNECGKQCHKNWGCSRETLFVQAAWWRTTRRHSMMVRPHWMDLWSSTKPVQWIYATCQFSVGKKRFQFVFLLCNQVYNCSFDKPNPPRALFSVCDSFQGVEWLEASDGKRTLNTCMSRLWLVVSLFMIALAPCDWPLRMFYIFHRMKMGHLVAKYSWWLTVWLLTEHMSQKFGDVSIEADKTTEINW